MELTVDCACSMVNLKYLGRDEVADGAHMAQKKG
jgi:hypothetical protein